MTQIQTDVTLDDCYTRPDGRVYVTGTQALIVAALRQKRLDARRGWRTEGFISGYRGSPLSVLDQECQRAREHLARHLVTFRPGLNEDLAATAVWGTQQVALDPRARVEGVFGMWYGKGAGLDRCGDVMRHAHGAGSSARGGVLVVCGDDHALKSSSQAYHCEPTFADLQMPVLYPSDMAEMIDFAHLGWEMSRFSGCWVGLKVLAETVNSTASVDIGIDDVAVVLPDEAALSPDRHIRWPDPWPQVERRLLTAKLPAALAFARANAIDREVIRARSPRLGIVTTGKSHLDLLEALATIGLDLDGAARRGISIYKVGMPWPLDAEGIARFARGHETLLVIEEKRDFIEAQIKSALYGLPDGARPSVIGRRDAAGRELLPSISEVTPDLIVRVLADLLPAEAPTPGLADRLKLLAAKEKDQAPALLSRTPYFCSGCPHSSSTVVPEGSRALGGVGCHYMAVDMERSTDTFTQMGGEGATWIGTAPFTETGHVFVNMGEGTYFHSGILAIRACIAAGANVTYKILFNDAVAMTGGQKVDGALTVPQITRQLRAEGVERIEVVADDPGKYPAGSAFATGVTLHPRADLDQVQRNLRETAGVSVLIYDQVCATEKRRRRKRGTMAAAPALAFINEAVCEGCGDCSRVSNCLAVEPVETAFGRKRRINQSACNQDTSCVNGFCPSFVTVRGGSLRRAKPAALPALDGLPDPRLPGIAVGGTYDILVSGVGGSGVVTIGAVLGMAAHLEGKGFVVHDRLGMAQKFGGVWSHVRIAARPGDIKAARLPTGAAQVVIGGDLTVVAEPPSLAAIDPERTLVIANTGQSITGAFTRDPDYDFKTAAIVARLRKATHAGCELVAATALASRLLGDAIGANMLLLGYAWQKGRIPLSRAAIERALELNGVAVATNKAAFTLGRKVAVSPESLSRPQEEPQPAPMGWREVMEHRAAFLHSYQDAAYARRYRGHVEAIAAAEERVAGAAGPLAQTVAWNLAKLMAYKDEYEVARLYADPAFARALQDTIEGGRLTFHLAPPLFARRDPVTGVPRKSAYGPWMLVVLRLLARFRTLRGTAFDPFGRHPERKAERALVARYEADLRQLAHGLAPDNMALAEAIARWPEKIRGFGHVKAEAVRAANAARGDLMDRFARAEPALSAAAE